MIIAKNGTQYNQITNEIIKAHATYVNSPFVKVNRALNYRDVNGHKILIDDFTPEELKAGLTEIVKIADAETRELYINKFFSSNEILISESGNLLIISLNIIAFTTVAPCSFTSASITYSIPISKS